MQNLQRAPFAGAHRAWRAKGDNAEMVSKGLSETLGSSRARFKGNNLKSKSLWISQKSKAYADS